MFNLRVLIQKIFAAKSKAKQKIEKTQPHSSKNYGPKVATVWLGAKGKVWSLEFETSSFYIILCPYILYLRPVLPFPPSKEGVN